MPINKFGTLLERSEVKSYYYWSGLLRNFVRYNTLCVIATNPNSRKTIRRVSLLVDDGEGANKRYVL